MRNSKSLLLASSILIATPAFGQLLGIPLQVGGQSMLTTTTSGMLGSSSAGGAAGATATSAAQMNSLGGAAASNNSGQLLIDRTSGTARAQGRLIDQGHVGGLTAQTQARMSGQGNARMQMFRVNDSVIIARDRASAEALARANTATGVTGQSQTAVPRASDEARLNAAGQSRVSSQGDATVPRASEQAVIHANEQSRVSEQQSEISAGSAGSAATAATLR